ncbi:hypothetical protein [uncultured Croceitalea sp.]|uniref:hypothetical protein n=1 Tax=uncultured Croceitalea sp. TaxID=1798908 RepID=UPI003305BC13
MDKINIGCVVYTMTGDGISAEWSFRRNDVMEQGHGIGTRLTAMQKSRPFEGEYEIIYQNSKGNRSPKLRLVISYHSGNYQLIWYENEKVTDIGIGFESDHKLIASYQKVDL